jgi:adenosylcobinamide hydrolase
MRYFLRGETLFIRGGFLAASTGIDGGVRAVSTLLNHTVPRDFDHTDPHRHLGRLVASEGFGSDFFGLLTAVGMKSLCILHYDFITAFITAGVSNPNPEGPGTINIIVYSSQPLTESAMLTLIITATEAKAKALADLGRPFTGTTTDAVIVACEGVGQAHEYGGTLTEAGRRCYEAVRFGVQEALKRYEGEVERGEPSFFIFSRYGGSHWVEWIKEGCPYYPCHFPGQSCDFCYCPFYPCGDEELGSWVESSSGGKVWSCQACTLVHEPEIADYLIRNPEAPLAELKERLKKIEKSTR